VPGSRDIDHKTRGARAREWDAIESIRPLADQRPEVRFGCGEAHYFSVVALQRFTPRWNATSGRVGKINAPAAPNFNQCVRLQEHHVAPAAIDYHRPRRSRSTLAPMRQRRLVSASSFPHGRQAGELDQSAANRACLNGSMTHGQSSALAHKPAATGFRRI
jgi:hypothetical protein